MTVSRYLVLAAVCLAPFAAQAQNSTLQPFTLSGKLYIQGSGEAQRRMPTGAEIGVLNQPLWAGATLTTTAVDATNRHVGFSGQVARDNNAVMLDYDVVQNGQTNFGYVLLYEGGRVYQEQNPVWKFTAPATGDKVHDIALTGMCSLTVHIKSQLPGDRFEHIYGVARVGAATIVASIGTNTKASGTIAKNANGYISSIDTDNKETATVEFLVRQDYEYNVDGRVIFAGLAGWVTTSQKSIQVDAANCQNAAVTITAKPPQEELKGSYWLKRDNDYTGGPVVSQYSMAFRAATLGGQYISMLNQYAMPTTDVPASFSFKPGVSRVQTEGGQTNTVGTAIHLKWPAPSTRTSIFYPPGAGGFWSPVANASNKQGVYPNGTVILSEDEIEEINFVGDMAFLEGDLLINGCADLSDVSTGDVHMSGHRVYGDSFNDETGTSGNTLIGATGSLSVTPLKPPSGEFELVGVPAPWVISRVNLQLSRAGVGPDNEGFLDNKIIYAPQPRNPITLEAKKVNAKHTTQNIPFGAVTVTLQTKNDDGSLRPFKSPTLYIPGIQEHDALGMVSSSNITSTGLSTMQQTHKVTILAPPGTATINASATVPANPDGTGATNVSSFPPLVGVPFRAPKQGGACAATCAVFGSRPDGTSGWNYYDDDLTDPTVSLSLNPALDAAGRTRAAVITVTGAVTDESPVDVQLYSDANPGSPYNVTVTGAPGAQTFTATVSLAIGLNSFTVDVMDRCDGYKQVQFTAERLPNIPPIITVPGAQTEDVNVGVTFTVTATDADGDDLTFTTSGPGTIDPTTGVYTLPANTLPGVYTVTFTVSDGELADTDTVTITIVQPNRPPVIVVPDSTTVAEGTPVTFTVTATDPDGDDLTFTTSGPGTIDPVTGIYTLPADTEPGTYTVTFTVSDGELIDSKTVTLTVTEKDVVPPVDTNRPPVFEPVGPLETDGPDGFLVVGTDPDGDKLTCTADKLPPGATFNPDTMRVEWDGITPADWYVAEITCDDGELSSTLVVKIHARVFDRVGGGWAGCSSSSGVAVGALLVVLAFAFRRRRFA